MMEKFKTTYMYVVSMYVLYVSDMFLVMGCMDYNIGAL